MTKASKPARELPKPMIKTSAVAERLGVTVYALNKLDRLGVLPHFRKRSIHISGKLVAVREWLVEDVERHASAPI
jgi:hypothetical protein